MSTYVQDSKFESEELTLEFDFLSRLTTGESAATAIVTASVFAGEDATPSAMISGLATVASNVVSQKIVGGIAGVIYLITCAVRTDDNNILINRSKLAILPDDAGTPAELA